MLEVVTTLAAEEAHSTSPHSRAASSPRDAQGTPAQSAAQDSSLQGTAEGAADIPKSPNDYTPTDASQTSGGDEGLLDLYALNREGKAIGQTSHSLGEKSEKKKVSSVKLGRNKDKGNLSEEHHDQDDHTTFVYEGFDATEAAVTPDLKRKSDETEELKRKSDETEELKRKGDETEELERKSDETEQVIIEEKDSSDVKSGDTEELDLEEIQSTARQRC
ncbi:hypothetical protein Tco_0135328, partial [Tanacetum coccineum]